MNTNPHNRSFIYFGALLLTSLLFTTACSRKIHFNNSTVVPAAEGTITVNKDHNSNYAIKVTIMCLAEPEKLTPPKKTYVVWLETKEHGQKNIGQLNISTGFLSKTLKGSLNTVTPYQPVSMYITAEDDAAKTYPGPQVVLTSETIK